MINRNDRPKESSDLRRQAEKIIHDKVARKSKNLETLSPEEISKSFHELQVHQIELDMQNEELRRAQAELEAARSRYFDLYDLAPVGYCTISEKGLILEANLTAASLLGLAVGTLTKKPFSSFIHKDDQNIYYLFRKKVFETDATQACELRIVKKDKTIIWVRLEATVVKDADSGPQCRLVISHITRHRQAEEELRDSERKLGFETLLAELSTRFINLPADQVDAGIIDAQQCICERLHLEISALWQVLSDRPDTLFMTHHHLSPDLPLDFPVVPEDMDAREYFPWCLKKMFKGERIILSRIMEAPAAAARDIESWHHFGIRSAITLPLSTGGDTVLGALNFNSVQYEMDWSIELVDRLQLVAQIFANALARKRSYEALRESEERYDLALRGANDGLWDWNLKTNAVFYSPRWKHMLGFAPDEIEPHISAWRRLLHPDDRARAFQVVDEVMRYEREYEIEFRLQHKDGHYVDILSRGFPVRREPGGAIVRIVGTHFDLTERRQLEQQLLQTLEEVQQLRDRLQMENVYLREQLRRDDAQVSIVGESKPILKTLEEAKRVAPTDSTVLLLGETGTGKELLAHAIHEMSSRKDRLLVLVNCASLPPTLIESELFGREKGAYTGSLTRMTGRFELADGSTLFLDEIGDLPLELQSKLLRVLEQGQFERLGSSRTIKVNVRLIAATNHDLAQDVSDGKFRKDLYYRLNVFPITISPLRDRKNDIPSLVWSFVNQFEKSLGKQIESIPKKSMEALMSYSWPGNIRELKNVIEHAMIMSNSTTLDIAPPARLTNELSGSYSLIDIERRHILEVLGSSDWRISGKNGAAEILGMKRTTLQSKIKALGIKRSVS